jgi:hypothetical protein
MVNVYAFPDTLKMGIQCVPHVTDHVLHAPVILTIVLHATHKIIEYKLVQVVFVKMVFTMTVQLPYASHVIIHVNNVMVQIIIIA